MLADFKYALRQLRKSLGFTLTAVLTLALGIGTNTAIFTLVDSIMLRPLPYPQPAQIMQIGYGDGQTDASFFPKGWIRALTKTPDPLRPSAPSVPMPNSISATGIQPIECLARR